MGTQELIRDTWSTPRDLFNLCQGEFSFNLDAAASATNAKVKEYISLEDNALDPDLPWGGYYKTYRPFTFQEELRVWLNPPYSRNAGGIGKWLKQCVRQLDMNPLITICVLIPPSFSANYWANYVDGIASEVRLCTPRVEFVAPKGVEASSNRGQSCLVVYDSSVLEMYGLGNVPTDYHLWKWQSEVDSIYAALDTAYKETGNEQNLHKYLSNDLCLRNGNAGVCNH